MPTDAGRGRRVAAAVGGVAVSAGLLWWAARGVDPGAVVAHARRADPALLLLAVAVATACFVVRAVRWRALLRDEHDRLLGLWSLWHATAAGFMANNLLPFRAGELIRGLVIRRLGPAGLPAALASVAVERVFDGLALVGLLVMGLFASRLDPDVAIAGVSVARAATAAGVFSAVALAGAVVLVAAPAWTARVATRVLPAPLAARIESLVRGLAAGASVLRSPARLAAVICWSIVHWLMNAAAFWIAARAFGIPLDFAGALLLQGVLAFGIAVPSTPGFIGPFEAVIVAVLALFAVPHDVAFSYAITYHLSTFVPITLLGLWSLSRASLTLASARAEAATA
jgi:uncharacterized protein (TIRG00374 family)